jgi:hypothetical protein
MSYHCPKCSGVIYNRRLNTCGFCSAKLPPELLFTAVEIEALDKAEAVSAELHQKKMADLEAEDLARKQAARRHSDFMSGYLLGRL